MSCIVSNKEQQTETTTSAAAAAPRSCLLDNARGFAATMVVFVHVTRYFMAQLVARHEIPTGPAKERTPDVDSWLFGCQLRDGILGSDLQFWFMSAARQFNMPIFCFVSGLCSQGATTRKRVVSFITAIIAPWLLFRLLAEPFFYNPLRDLSLYNLCDFGNPHPVYDDWYMVALIVWKAVTLCCSKLSPYKIAFCMIMSSFAFEYVDLSVPWAPFAFTRTFKFTPYFAVGYSWPPETILQTPMLSSLTFGDKVRVGGFLCFGAFMMIPLFMDVFGTDFSDTFVSARQFEGMPSDFLLAWVQIIARVSKNLLVMIPVLTFVIPREETIFTSIGRLTLYPFFLHRILLEHRLNFMVNANPPVWTSNFAHIMVYIGHYGLCVAVCRLLTSDPVGKLFGWAIEPKWLETLFEELVQSEVRKEESTVDLPPATGEATGAKNS
jgi:fucose 4-O-acetylase-like acetyltransferase